MRKSFCNANEGFEFQKIFMNGGDATSGPITRSKRLKRESMPAMDADEEWSDAVMGGRSTPSANIIRRRDLEEMRAREGRKARTL